jgi:hypothetical protein
VSHPNFTLCMKPSVLYHTTLLGLATFSLNLSPIYRPEASLHLTYVYLIIKYSFLICRFILWVLSFVIPGLGMFSEAYYVFAVGNLKRESWNKTKMCSRRFLKAFYYFGYKGSNYEMDYNYPICLHDIFLQPFGRLNTLHAGLRIRNALPNFLIPFHTPKSEALSAANCFWVLSLTELVVSWDLFSRQPRCLSVPFSLRLRTVPP